MVDFTVCDTGPVEETMWSIYGNWFPGMDLLLVGITCALLQNTLQFIAINVMPADN